MPSPAPQQSRNCACGEGKVAGAHDLDVHAQQEQAESDKAAQRASERTQGEQLASSRAATAAAPCKDGEGKGDLLDQIMSQVSPPFFACCS